MKVKLKLPKKRLDLKRQLEAGQIKILWSQQLADEETERQRQEAAHQAKVAEHNRLSKLLGACISKKGKASLFDQIQEKHKP